MYKNFFKNMFIFSFSQLSIDSFEEVGTVSFRLVVAEEETLRTICKTEEITLTK